MKTYSILFLIFFSLNSFAQDCHLLTRDEIRDLYSQAHHRFSDDLNDAKKEYVIDIISLSLYGLPKYRKIPDSVYQFKFLQDFSIQGDSLTNSDFSRLHELKCLQYLELWYVKITVFPSGINKIAYLKELKMDSNGLKTVPGSIFNHPVLEKLDLSSQLSAALTLPTDVKNSNLRELDLSKCNIYTIPEGFFNIPKLETLNLRKTKIKTLPKDIYKLKNVQVLELSDTNLESLPDELAQLDKLVTIGLNRTHLKAFPEVLFKLKKIRAIYIMDSPEYKLSSEVIEATENKFKELGNTRIEIYW